MATKLMNQFQVSGYVAKVSLCYPPHKGTYVVNEIMLVFQILALCHKEVLLYHHNIIFRPNLLSFCTSN